MSYSGKKQELTHCFIGYDEGSQTLGLHDTVNKNWGWTLSLKSLPLARDIQRIDRNIVLIGFEKGYFEIDINSGKPIKIVDFLEGVTSVYRRDDGYTLLTGVNLMGEGISVLTLDPKNKIVNSVYKDGDYVRLMRPTPEGTWLLGSDDHFLETNNELKEIRRFTVTGFEHAWMAHRFNNGSTLFSAGYGAFMTTFDKCGKLISKFGGKEDVPKEVSPFFYASFQLLPNGGFIVANWQGHGGDNGDKGRQLVEFDNNGKFSGAWSNPKRISSLQGILLL